eukprot:gene12485-biopygen12896
MHLLGPRRLSVRSRFSGPAWSPRGPRGGGPPRNLPAPPPTSVSPAPSARASAGGTTGGGLGECPAASAGRSLWRAGSPAVPAAASVPRAPPASWGEGPLQRARGVRRRRGDGEGGGDAAHPAGGRRLFHQERHRRAELRRRPVGSALALGKVVKSSGGLICPLADFGGLGGPAGGLADWRTLPGGLWRTGGIQFLATPREGHNSFSSVQFLAIPREGRNSFSSVQFLAIPREGHNS